MANNDDAKVNSKYDDTIIVKVGGLLCYEYPQDNIFETIDDLTLITGPNDRIIREKIKETRENFTKNNDTKQAFNSLSEIAQDLKIDIGKSNNQEEKLESLCNKIREILPDKITCHRSIQQFFHRPENCEMSKKVKENINDKDKDTVKIISWSWGNYEALELVEWALENGKNVEWSILNVANELYLNPLYYMGYKESFLNKLKNSDKIKKHIISDRIEIKYPPLPSPDTPSSTCCPIFSYSISDAISLHPKAEIKNLRKIVSDILEDHNTVSI